MSKVNQFSQEVLLDYLDGNLEPVKREAVEKALRNDGDLQQRLEQLRKADNMLRNVKLEQPSKNFTSMVLQRLDEYPLKSGLSIRNGIFLLTGIMVIVAVALVLLSMGVFDQSTTTFDPNEIDMVQKYVPKDLPAIPFDGKLMVNIIVILNLAVMFVVLDRAILKPFFQKRIQAGQ